MKAHRLSPTNISHAGKTNLYSHYIRSMSREELYRTTSQDSCNWQSRPIPTTRIGSKRLQPSTCLIRASCLFNVFRHKCAATRLVTFCVISLTTFPHILRYPLIPSCVHY